MENISLKKSQTLSEPAWFALAALPQDLNPTLKSWLVEQGSLTKRLRGGDGQFRVECQSQAWGEVRASEQQLLQLPLDARAQIRVVKEFRDQNVIIYARTVLPENLLAGLGERFKTLGDRPIGEVLFSDPNLTRGPFEFAKINASHYDFNQATAHLNTQPKWLWARRSVFYCYSQQLLITEIFLPELYGYKA